MSLKIVITSLFNEGRFWIRILCDLHYNVRLIGDCINILLMLKDVATWDLRMCCNTHLRVKLINQGDKWFNAHVTCNILKCSWTYSLTKSVINEHERCRISSFCIILLIIKLVYVVRVHHLRIVIFISTYHTIIWNWKFIPFFVLI